MMWVWAIACGPRLPLGPSLAERAAAPVPVEVLPAGEPAVLLEIDAGSGRDPAGREGTAYLVASAIVGSLGGTVTVGVREVRAEIPCGEDLPACAEAVATELVHPRWEAASLAAARAEAARALVPPDDATLAGWAADLVRWRAHPWGHLPAGRTSVLPTLAVEELRRFHAARWTRPSVRVTARGLPPPAVEALRTGLSALPPGVDPLRPHGGDAPPLRPLPAGGAWVVVREGGPETTVRLAWPAGAALEAVTEAIEAELVDAALLDSVTMSTPAGDDGPRVEADALTSADRLAATVRALPALPAGATLVAVTDREGGVAAAEAGAIVVDAALLTR